VTIVRVGTNKNYSTNWESAFGKGKKKAATAAPAKKSAAKKSAKASPKKKSAKKKK
jgi:nitroimidazol reductase NimA-like FMN-containing flavoprotein (pyridoxamine 5'-phosphate oxidase superfamily)